MPIDDPEAVAVAVAAIRADQIIAYPTDTVYGVGGSALSGAAVQRVAAAKGRPAGKGFPVLLGAADESSRLAREWPEAAAALAERFWPGPLTIVVPGRAGLPDETCLDGTVALRVPDLPALRHLIGAAGVPLIGTSANRSGAASANTALEAAAALGHSVAVVLDGGPRQGLPSTVIQVDGNRARILRPGAVAPDALAAALGPLGAILDA
jgi:L-threonylcarbamoyladenylate synthase